MKNNDYVLENFIHKFGKEKGEEIFNNLNESYYSPSNSFEYYDNRTNTWYNKLGDVLRDPEEYNVYSEGYTPFGDE